MKKMVFYYIGNESPPDVTTPKQNELVDVYQCPVHGDSYRIIGYERTPYGVSQTFHKRHFREPISNKSVSAELVEELQNNPEWVKTVPEKIESMSKAFTTEADF